MGDVVFSVSGTRVTRGKKALQALQALCLYAKCPCAGQFGRASLCVQTGPLEILLHALFAIVRNLRVCEAWF